MCTTRSEQARGRADKVHEESNEITHHAAIVTNLSSITNLGNHQFTSKIGMRTRHVTLRDADLGPANVDVMPTLFSVFPVPVLLAV